MARPKQNKEMRVTCSVTLPVPLVEWLRDHAWEHRTTVSHYIETLVVSAKEKESEK